MTIHLEAANTSAVRMRRLVNDEIRGVGAGLPDDEAPFEFLCECGNLRCRQNVTLTLAEYDASQPGGVSAHL
jgi:hypothetical protein